MTDIIKAATYVRMSTDRQDKSPDQQRDEIERRFTPEYEIVRRYEDLGISGDRTDKRIGFQQMIADAVAGEFEAILCWDQDRFGRFDTIEAGKWIHPLRESGVHLATVTDGVCDWNSFAGRLTYSVKQEGKHQYLRDLSQNVTRAMDQAAAEGLWVSGVPPLGYVVDADRKLQLGEPADIALVKDIFRRYLGGDSLRQISTALSDRGIRSPKGTKWTTTGLSNLLKNERYLGYGIYGQRSESKYKTASNPKGKRKTLPRSEWIIVQDSHPAIITPGQFEAVQQMMKSNTRKTSPNPDQINALTGLLRCGHCGYGMSSDLANGVRAYSCYSYAKRPGDCERYSVREKEALGQILGALRTEYFDKLTPGTIAALKAEMLKQLSGDRADVDVMESQLGKVEHQLEQAADRLLEVPPDMVGRIVERIRTKENHRDQLRARIAAATATPRKQITAAEERIKTALAWLSDLEAIAETNYDGAAVNRMLRQFVDKVELHFERVQWGPSGKRHKCNLVGGIILFRTGGIGRFNSGDLSGDVDP